VKIKSIILLLAVLCAASVVQAAPAANQTLQRQVIIDRLPQQLYCRLPYYRALLWCWYV
jgi:hypothetical protein